MSEPAPTVVPIPDTNTVLVLDGQVASIQAAPLPPAALAAEAAPDATAPKAPFASVVLTVEMWARRKKTHPVILKAAIVGAKWQVGDEFDPCLVTEEEFDRAVSFAENPHAHANPPKKA